MAHGDAPDGGGMSRIRWTTARQTRFLEMLALTANVSASAAAAGLGRTMAYCRRTRDPAFAAAWDAALDQAMDELLAVVFGMAKNGVTTTMTVKGKPVRTVHSQSPLAAVRLLKLYRPSLYPAHRPSPKARANEAALAERIARAVHARDLGPPGGDGFGPLGRRGFAPPDGGGGGGDFGRR